MKQTEFYQTLARHLGANLRYLREQRELTQARLAKLCDLPRSTIAMLETGSANPSLAILTRVARALHVSLEELVSTPKAQSRLYKKGELPISSRSGEAADVAQLLPDSIPGMEIERLELIPGGEFTGSLHRPGTREYFACERGNFDVWILGDKYKLSHGDVLVFSGDQPHSYHNFQTTPAVGFSVVIFTPLALRQLA